MKSKLLFLYVYVIFAYATFCILLQDFDTKWLISIVGLMLKGLTQMDSVHIAPSGKG